MTKAAENASKEETTPHRKPLLSGENHSQASKRAAIWNTQVPKAVKVLYIATKNHALVHTMKLMEPVRMQKQLRQRAAFNGILNSIVVAIGVNRLTTMSIAK